MAAQIPVVLRDLEAVLRRLPQEARTRVRRRRAELVTYRSAAQVPVLAPVAAAFASMCQAIPPIAAHAQAPVRQVKPAFTVFVLAVGHPWQLSLRGSPPGKCPLM